jgi:HlyD family secretion protein
MNHRPFLRRTDLQSVRQRDALQMRPTRFWVLAAMLFAAIGCQRAPSEQPSAASGDDKPAATVAVVYPEQASIHREVSNPGFIEAFEETPVFAKVSGYVKEGWKDIGAKLRKGEILAELSAPEMVDELEQKESLIEQAETGIAQAREASRAAEAAYHSAVSQVAVAEANRLVLLKRQDRTQKQYARLQRMASAVLDREQVEEAQLGYETAKASVVEAEAKIKAAQALCDEAKAKWSKAVADLRAAEIHRKVAEKNRDYAKDLVGYLKLTAPYDCIVTQRHVKTGDFVQMPNNGQGKPLYIVHRMDRMRIFLQVPESDAAWIEEGVAASIRVPKLQGWTFSGRVSRISWSLDAATRTLRAEIDADNPDGRLRPGMYAYVTLSADSPGVLTLPRSAVATEGDVTRGYQSYCYQVEDGKARRLTIGLGSGDSKRVEVLRKRARPEDAWEEFNGSEQIVQGNLSELHPGHAVIAQPKKP